MRKILIMALLLQAGWVQAQVTLVSLQASGLTCSMCSNAINKALLSLPAVASVEANIKDSRFVIGFKTGVPVNFDAIKEKVEGAGFFVADFRVTMNMEAVKLDKDLHVRINDIPFHFMSGRSPSVGAVQTVQVIDKGFISAKNFKSILAKSPHACLSTGKADKCCTDAGFKTAERVYHVR